MHSFISRMKAKLQQALSMLVKQLKSSNTAQVLKFSTASISNSGISIAAGFLSYALISPAEIGIWKSLLLFNQYAVFLGLGVISNGLIRELSFALGQKDHEEATHFAETGLFHSLVLVIVFTASTAVFLLV
ncbi:hypothetical protein GF324_13810, partial [bacterium]|nr:hypothetical protein [bacterium]